MAFGPEKVSRKDRGSPLQTELQLTDCVVQGLHIRDLTCLIQSDGRITKFKDIDGSVGSESSGGPVRGWVSLDADTRLLCGKTEFRFQPSLLVPVLQAWNMHGTVRLVRHFEFDQTPPDCMLDVTRQCTSNGSTEVSGKIRMEDCRYKGVNVPRADARVRLVLSETNSSITIDPLYIVRDEGVVRGGLTMDFDEDVIAFDGFSTIQPLALIRMVDVFSDDFLTNFFLEGSAVINASGEVGRGSNDLLAVRAKVDGRRIGSRRHVADECSFYLHTVGRTNTLSGIRGRIYGGTFEGNATCIRPANPASNMVYSVQDAEIRDIDLKRFLAAMGKGGDGEVRGKVTAHLDLQGCTGKERARTATGRGRLRITDGQIFTLPLFGGMTEILTKIIPGLNFVLSQSDARADFRVGGGKVHTGEVRIEGDVVSLSGRGDYRFDKQLDFKVQANLLKHKTAVGRAIHLLLSPLGWLLEFRLTGTLDEPKWYLRTFSKDLLKKLGMTKTDGTGK
jgi:hypothetical protein